MTSLLLLLYLCVVMRRYLRIDFGGLKLCTFALLYVVICLRTVGREEGLFTCRTKHVFACRMTFKFKFTARVVRSSTYVLFIPFQISWQTTPFCSLRVAHDESFRVARVVQTDASLSQYPSRCVAFTVRCVLNMCSDCQTLSAEPNWNEPIRVGIQTYVMKWKHSHCTTNLY